MKRYILGFLAFVGLNFAGLFSLGMIVGFVMALGGERNADTLLIATEGDRCDLLATEFYGTPELWWFVALSNNLSSNKPAQLSNICITFAPAFI